MLQSSPGGPGDVPVGGPRRRPPSNLSSLSVSTGFGPEFVIEFLEGSSEFDQARGFVVRSAHWSKLELLELGGCKPPLPSQTGHAHRPTKEPGFRVRQARPTRRGRQPRPAALGLRRLELPAALERRFRPRLLADFRDPRCAPCGARGAEPGGRAAHGAASTGIGAAGVGPARPEALPTERHLGAWCYLQHSNADSGRGYY